MIASFHFTLFIICTFSAALEAPAAVHSLCSLSSLIYESQLFIQFPSACLYVIPWKTTVNSFYFKEAVYLQRRSLGTGDNTFCFRNILIPGLCMCFAWVCLMYVCSSLRNSLFFFFFLVPFNDMTESTSSSLCADT